MERMVQVYTFGGLKILREGEPIPSFDTRKTEALIVYLACTRKPQAREVLTNLLWDERSQRQALSNLRVAIASLRKQLGDDFEITRDTIALNPQAEIWSDVGEFEARLNAVRAAGGMLSAEEAEQVGGALDLYQGKFLEGFYIREGSGFDDGQVRERERLHHMAVGGLYDLVAHDLQAGDYPAGYGGLARTLAAAIPTPTRAVCQRTWGADRQ